MESKLPEDWELKTIQSVCREKIQSGGTPLSKTPKYYENGTIPWVITADMTEAGMYITKTKKKITQAGYDSSSTRMFPKGTILFSMYGSIGKACITEIELCTNQAILGIIPDKDIVLTKYLYYCLQRLTNEFMEMGRGGTQSNINAKMVKEYKIPVPPLPVQKSLVKKLDAFFKEYDILKEEKQKAKENHEIILQSSIKKLCKPDSIPENWNKVLIKDICKIVSGSTPKTKNPEYWDGSILWITPKDLTGFEGMYISNTKRKITQEGYDSCSTTLVPKGTVLMSSRAPIGYLAIADQEMCTNQGFKSFVCSEKIFNKYLFFYLKSIIPELKQSGSGTTFNEISKSKAERIAIMLPSIQEQKEIVQKIEMILNFKDSIKEYREDISKNILQLPHSVLTKAFQGELIV